MTGHLERPLFHCSIHQLESLFEERRSDFTLLQQLKRELDYRAHKRKSKGGKQSSRLLMLRQKVEAELLRTPGNRAVAGIPKRVPLPASKRSPPPPEPDDENRVFVPPLAGRNQPSNILAAWTALEALSPQTYRRPEDFAAGDRSCVVDITSAQLPWQLGERSRLGKRLYYHVILGSIPMDRATDALVSAFGEDEGLGSRIREKAAIAALLLDRNGLLLEENSVAVSSFAWALPLALQQRLDALGDWPRIETRVVGQLVRLLRETDDSGASLPINAEAIDRAYRWLTAEFDLPSELIEAPQFALRVFHYYKARNPPELPLLNSFFLGDLARARSLLNRGRVPIGLRRYLGTEKPEKSYDLLTDRAALEKAVSPAKVPRAKWPSPGGHPLVLLQQAAVNLARSELAGSEGIVAVNGPPGTGKTTLLRDIVAAAVLDRALAMATFDDPETAFTPSGEKVSFGGKAFAHLYSLSELLRGHEVLVASSNNKAVENISRELPGLAAIGRPLHELNYFKSVSDAVHGPGDAESWSGSGNRRMAEPAETWGLIAAVLGNAKNRAAFVRSFWWHNDWAFRLYLKAAKGDALAQAPVPGVIAAEAPPSPDSAKVAWRKARDRLLLIQREVEAELGHLETVRQQHLELPADQRTLAAQQAALSKVGLRQQQVKARREELQLASSVAEEACASLAEQARRHDAIRPGLSSRLFRTRSWREWSRFRSDLQVRMTEAADHLADCDRDCSTVTLELEALDKEARALEQKISVVRQKIAKATRTISHSRAALGEQFVDDQFFDRGHRESNLASPWISQSLQRRREDLFIAALAVHRAFIGAAAQKILHNLSVLMDVLMAGPPQDPAKRRVLGDLWSTLFMVVPVLSTTFASVERMLGVLPPVAIGWLLIDEAGQALPQAAVGAILRSRRSIVVGDPLQVPPVTSLPERLQREICRFFEVDGSAWAAPDASAQALADRASKYQGAFQSEPADRRVGIPLLVHRRCQDPMFGLSNRIAYDGKMVHAVGMPNPGPIGTALGPSAWFDIAGMAESKWCPLEGELVVAVLNLIASAGVTDPDLFIITPFRIVAQELRRRLGREEPLLRALGVDGREWVMDRVGTIHTVQGREADSVILVLGAPMVTQAGARSWATSTPNIINVAVSRAKQNLYVVGSYDAWSTFGHARQLATLPLRRLSPVAGWDSATRISTTPHPALARRGEG